MFEISKMDFEFWVVDVSRYIHTIQNEHTMTAMRVFAVVMMAMAVAATPDDDLFDAVMNDDKKRIGSALHHGANINAIVSD